MFQSISWQGYWLTIALLSVAYYLFIYLLYYRSDFKIWLHRKGQPFPGRDGDLPFRTQEMERAPAAPQSTLFDAAPSPDFADPEPDSEEGVVYRCMDELQAFFEEARKSHWSKEQLTGSLRRILLKYPSLKTSPYRESLGKVLVNQCEHYCSIHLSAEEAVRVWPEG